MPLDKFTLKQELQEAFDFESDKDVDPAEARERQAQKMANAFEKYVKSGDVSTNITGTSATGGAVTGTGTGKLS